MIIDLGQKDNIENSLPNNYYLFNYILIRMLVNGVLKSWNLIPILPLLQQQQKKLLLKNQNLLKNAKIKLKKEDVRNGRSKRNVTKHSSRKNVKRLVKLAKLVKK